jgi:hypothetical protein
MIKLHVQLNLSNSLLVQSKNIISSQTSGLLKLNTLCPLNTLATEYRVCDIISQKNGVLRVTPPSTSQDSHTDFHIRIVNFRELIVTELEKNISSHYGNTFHGTFRRKKF